MADLSRISDMSGRDGRHRGRATSRIFCTTLARLYAAAAAAAAAVAAAVCLVGPSRQLVLGVTAVGAAVLLGWAAVRGGDPEPAPVPEIDPVSGMAVAPPQPDVARTTDERGQSFWILVLGAALASIVVVLSGWHVARELQVRRNGVPGTAAVASVPGLPWGDPVCVYVYGLTRPGPPLCGRLVGAWALKTGGTVVIHVDREDPAFVGVDSGLPIGVDMLVVSLALAVSLGALGSRQGWRRRSGLPAP